VTKYATKDWAIADLIADVRHETREATIRECEAAIVSVRYERGKVRDRLSVARLRVLALLTPPSAPAEPDAASALAKSAHAGRVAAEQRLADLVREVRGWYDTIDGEGTLFDILARYEQPTEVAK
jgi:hypothetical protein